MEDLLTIVLLSIALIYIMRCVYAFFFDVKVKIHYIDNRFNNELTKRCPSFFESYRPNIAMTAIIGVDHLVQTARNGNVVPEKCKTIRLQKIKLDDGGILGLQWLDADRDIPGTTPIVVSFPPVGYCSAFSGLSGILCHEINEKLGYRVVQVVYQGLGGLPLTSKHLPGTGYCGLSDPGEAVRNVHIAHPNAKILVMGCSIGSAIFTRWAGANPQKCKEYQIIGSLFCAHGFSAQETTERGDTMFMSLGGKNVVSIWKKQIQENNSDHLKKLDGTNGFSADALLAAQLSGRWDEALLPLYGYKSKSAMFKNCDAANVLRYMNIPALYINADDDPVCPAARMRRKERPDLLTHPMAILLGTRRGGHLGWHDGIFASERRWIRNVICQYFRAIVDLDMKHDDSSLLQLEEISLKERKSE